MVNETESSANSLAGIDTHAHVFMRDLPLAQERRYEPDYDATLDDYLEQLDTQGLGGGVLVQPSFYGTDNGFLLDCVATWPERLRGVVVVDPGISARELRSLRERGAVGIRINLIGVRRPDLADPAWQLFLRTVADVGLHVEVQATSTDWTVLMPPLLASGANIVVDHFGRPSAKLGAEDPGFQAILRAAQTGRVWVKMSGPYRFGYEAAAACARLLAAEPGPERLLWGSDWPWTQFEKQFDYAQSMEWLFDWLPTLRQRWAVLRDTPQMLYQFDEKVRALA